MSDVPEFSPEEIHALRMALNESCAAFGRRFGVSHQAVSKWESPESSPYHTRPSKPVRMMMVRERNKVFGVIR